MIENTNQNRPRNIQAGKDRNRGKGEKGGKVDQSCPCPGSNLSDIFMSKKRCLWMTSEMEDNLLAVPSVGSPQLKKKLEDIQWGATKMAGTWRT